MICSMWVPGEMVSGDKPEHKYQCEGKPRNTELIVQGTVYGTVSYIFGEDNITLNIYGTYPSRGFMQGMYQQVGKTKQYYVRSIITTVPTYWKHQNMKYGVQILIRQITRNIDAR